LVRTYLALKKNAASLSSNPAPTSHYRLHYKSKTEERETYMKKIAQWCVITRVAASAIFAATNPMVGGHEMFPTKNIVQNAVNSEDHATVVAAVKAISVPAALRSPRNTNSPDFTDSRESPSV
jgi:hypothetical protein